MTELKIEKHLKKLTVWVAMICVLILLAGSLLTVSLNHVQQEGINNRIQNEVEKYREDLLQKIRVDFQTIYTLSAFLEFNGGLDRENFSRGLLESNNHNSFVRMGYFNRNGTGIRVTSGRDIETDVSLKETGKGIQRIIRKAWEGEAAFFRRFL